MYSNKTFQFIFFIGYILFFSACSQKITIKSIQPSTFYDKDIKNLTIDPFDNDDVSLSSNIYSIMNTKVFNGQNYFTIINRSNRDLILEEQTFQDSGMVNTTKEFDLAEVNSIITGKIDTKTHTKNRFYKTFTDYNICIKYKTNKEGKKVCETYKKYNVTCYTHNYFLNATIQINRVSNGNIIFSKTFSNKTSQEQCKNSSSSIAPEEVVFIELSKHIAKEFVDLISPTYHTMQVVLKDDPDIEYTKTQENLLENSLKLIDLGYTQKANDSLIQLANSTNFQSVTALYNLAITYEALGNLQKAKDILDKVQSISIIQELDEDILVASERIKTAIKNKKLATNQINN